MSRKLRRRLTPYLLAAPALVLIIIFLYGVFQGVLQGFGIMPWIPGHDKMNLDYFAEVFSDPELTSSISFSFYLAAVSSLIAVIGGVALSAALTRLHATRTMRLFGLQVPLMTAHIIVVFGLLALLSSSGFIPRLLHVIGLVQDSGDFDGILGAENAWGVILVYVWKEIPFVAFCTVTIMGNIGDSYAEAAATLGASPLRTFFSVTLPLCKSAIAKAFLIVFAFVFGAYEVPVLLGPTLPRALPAMAYFEFTKTDLLNRGYAMALNGVSVGICVLLAIAYFLIMASERRRERREEA